MKICSCGREIRPYRNSTIYPKKCPSCTLKENANKCVLTKSNYKTVNVSQKQIKTHSERQKAIKRADLWFSRYIRVKFAINAGKNWICKCYTCGNYHAVSEIQNGHWRRRGFFNTRWHLNNCRPQCVRCNYHRSGEPEKFERYLIRDLGEEVVDKIRKLSLQIDKVSVIEISEYSEMYKSMTNEIIKKKNGVKWW